MNYFVSQQYDPSSQTQESYNQFNSFPPQSYAYPNPQFTTTIHPNSYQQNPLVKPSQHHEQEPNPPGVSPPPQPETYQNSYYQYTDHSAAAAAGVPTAGSQPVAVEAVAHTVVHQPKY